MEMLAGIVGRPTVPPVKMGDPGPDDAALQSMLRAAAAAPDHGKLCPWRYLVVRGGARARLGELLAAAVLADNRDASEAEIAKQREAPLRCPMLLVAIARVDEGHVKVPAIEQLLAAGASVQNLLLAAHGLGLAAKWATGKGAYSATLRDGLGLGSSEQVIGLIYLGTPMHAHEPSPRPDPATFASEWTG